MTVRQLLAEPLRADRLKSREREARIAGVLSEVGLDVAYADRFPHQLSGGQKQRVAIARALIRRPSFIVADEAVSALDVTVRAQILKLFASLQQKYGFSCVFVSHDLAAVEEVADRVVVMRNGRIEEQGSVAEVFDHPRTDYTRELLSALPVLKRTEKGVQLGWRDLIR
jgi:peptide/nickel transport system ATP-binding protein